MSAEDTMFIMITFFVVAVIGVIAYFIGSTTIAGMIAVPSINESTATVSALQGGESHFNKFDSYTLAVLIGSALAILISGFFVGGHPIFMGIYFIVVIITVVVSAVVSNVYGSFIASSSFATTSASFPITNHIMSLLPMYMSIIGILGLIAMFAKPYIFGGQQ